jgi:hypothetical protein
VFLIGCIVPPIPLGDLPALLAFTFASALIAGCYGVLHDQIAGVPGKGNVFNFPLSAFSQIYHFPDTGKMMGNRSSCIFGPLPL